MIGAVLGAAALLVLPADAFRAVVPVLIGLACVLVVVQPQRVRLAAPGAAGRHTRTAARCCTPACSAPVSTAATSAQRRGCCSSPSWGLLLDEDLQRINAAKNVLAGLVNLVAALVFIAVTDVAWLAAGLIALGAVVGGQLGAQIGRRVPPGRCCARLVVRGRRGRDRRDRAGLVSC